MSKEFEEIVLNKLEKLDTLEEELKNTNQKIDNTNKEVSSMKQEIKNINQRLGKLEVEVKDTGEIVQYLNNNFTIFDHEINNKINTLVDAFKVNSEKDLVHEENISSLDKKVLNHDIRISNLEDKVLIA